MKLKTLAALLILFSVAGAQAQKTANSAFRNFPIVIGVQFQSIGLPFKSFKTNFANPGFRLGTEIKLGSTQRWAQGFNIGYNVNQAAGNSFVAYTQTMFRPNIGRFFTEVNGGIGLIKCMHPTAALAQADGKWVSLGSAGKTMLMVPAGISVGYNGYRNGTYFSPFVRYQVTAVANYNRIIPVLPISAFEVGTRIHLNYQVK